MKKRIIILIFLSLISCKQNKLINNETEAVQQVLNFYNGECKKSKGIIFKNGENESYFELEISKSKLLNIDLSNLKSHSANIAYLFYSNLSNTDAYDNIKVKINLSDGSSEEFSYSNEKLYEVEKLQPFISNVIEEIKLQKYDELVKLFDNTVGINSKNIEGLFNKVEKEFGKIKKTQFQGFEFKEEKEFGNVIVIKEAFVFEKLAVSMNIIIKSSNSKIIALEFE
ncbi:hypothetical protein L1276_000529 [Flavobacterium sp. HSC-32F16]|uniref:hypothetical protein n=1 Tax=Flavobacterium sp. HSC-32F16 TaxID=2910964 RepID=UPI0020A46C64|nr:hypothetical protein [Flavobacterium sp. HSC-32F16]MCP2025389.1 hypothetical protein [Flavobacterium sp. HSC-32F16]